MIRHVVNDFNYIVVLFVFDLDYDGKKKKKKKNIYYIYVVNKLTDFFFSFKDLPVCK